MSSSNQRRNQAFIKQYRKELGDMLGDISQIDQKVLTESVSAGFAYLQKNTPVGQYPAGSGKVGGTLKKGWQKIPTQKTGNSTKAGYADNVYYGPYVNYGHRIVVGGKTVGYYEGQHFVERADNVVEKMMVKEFDAEIKRVKAKHGG